MIAIAPARNIPQIGGERHPAQKEEGSGMSDLQTRLEVFSEFLDCAGVALWHYDGEMRLLRSNHPCKEDLQQLFGAAESKTRILDYCRQNRLPCLGPDSAALLWMAAPYKVNGVLTDIYVIGPVFPSAISEQALTAALGKVHMPPELTNQVRELLKTVPSVQYSLLVQYGVMLYRCLYEEKIDPSDIQWLASPLEPRAPRTVEENVNTRRGTYAFEQEFFRIVEEGNVNAERPQSSIQIQPGFLSRTDPLRHAKNMAIAELTLICRAAIRGGLPEDTAYGLADFYIQNSEDCRNTAQVYQLATMPSRTLRRGCTGTKAGAIPRRSTTASAIWNCIWGKSSICRRLRKAWATTKTTFPPSSAGKWGSPSATTWPGSGWSGPSWRCATPASPSSRSASGWDSAR